MKNLPEEIKHEILTYLNVRDLFIKILSSVQPIYLQDRFFYEYSKYPYIKMNRYGYIIVTAYIDSNQLRICRFRWITLIKYNYIFRYFYRRLNKKKNKFIKDYYSIKNKI